MRAGEINAKARASAVEAAACLWIPSSQFEQAVEMLHVGFLRGYRTALEDHGLATMKSIPPCPEAGDLPATPKLTWWEVFFG